MLIEYPGSIRSPATGLGVALPRNCKHYIDALYIVGIDRYITELEFLKMAPQFGELVAVNYVWDMQ